MLCKASTTRGYAIMASDGHLGSISDFLFDDNNWSVRWVVVDTGKWLSGRKVPLPSAALGRLDSLEREFAVGLTMRQVKESPDINAQRPVSRQIESNIYDYYGWQPYWGTGLLMGGYDYAEGAMSVSPVPESRLLAEDVAAARRRKDDPHLRSIQEVTGYHIHASDGEIGHIEDFLIDFAEWSIRYLLIDTQNWWPGQKVLISPQSVKDVNWMDRIVNLKVDRRRVKESPPYDEYAAIDQAYDKRFRSHYDDVHPANNPQL